MEMSSGMSCRHSLFRPMPTTWKRRLAEKTEHFMIFNFDHNLIKPEFKVYSSKTGEDSLKDQLAGAVFK